MRVAIIQPILTSYRLPVMLDLSRYCQVDLFFSPTDPKFGFGSFIPPQAPNLRYFQVPTWKPFGDKIGMMQFGLVKYLFRERPDAVVIFANPRYVTFWTTLLWCRLRGIRVYAHGHGLYKWSRVGSFYRLVVKAMLWLVTGYIAYAPLVRESFAVHGFSDKKVSVADNTLAISLVVRPEEKSGTERGVLFVGRLRQDSELELLLRTLARIRQEDGIPLSVHVIGTGECWSQLREEFGAPEWIHWYGEVYEESRIREISRDCFLGCYPGDAGLSVLHMMALSLPVVTHKELSRHKGPEPSFIQDGVGGVLYDRAQPESSLYETIRLLAQQPDRVARMRRAAFERYQELVQPSLGARLWRIVGQPERNSTSPDGCKEALDGRAADTVSHF